MQGHLAAEALTVIVVVKQAVGAGDLVSPVLKDVGVVQGGQLCGGAPQGEGAGEQPGRGRMSSRGGGAASGGGVGWERRRGGASGSSVVWCG